MAYIPKNPNGQTTMANSEPVVIASDQTPIPVNIINPESSKNAAVATHVDDNSILNIAEWLALIEGNTGAVSNPTSSINQSNTAFVDNNSQLTTPEWLALFSDYFKDISTIATQQVNLTQFTQITDGVETLLINSDGSINTNTGKMDRIKGSADYSRVLSYHTLATPGSNVTQIVHTGTTGLGLETITEILTYHDVATPGSNIISITYI